MKYLGRALVYLFNYWPTALGGGLALLAVNAANLIAPQVLRMLIDQGISALDMRQVAWAALALVGVAVGRGVGNFLQGYWSEVTSQGVAYDLRNAIFEKLQKLSFSYHDHTQTGKLMTNITSDVELVRTFVGNGLLQLISALILLIGTIVILFMMNWRLAAVILAIVPLIMVTLATFVRRIMPVSGEVQEKLGALNTILQENIAGMRVVKAFAREEHEQSRFGKGSQELLEANMRLIKLFTSIFPMIFFIANLGVLAVVWMGGNQVIGGELTLGELVAFNGYLGFLLMPMFMMGMLGAMLSRATASARRIFEVIDAESEVHDRPGAQPLPPVRGRVVFDQVGFRYIGGEKQVLDNVTFTAEPGKTIAILGETGSGKSTIINLIPRFYDVSSGAVTIDGLDIREVTLDSLRAQIGIVLQETTLFSGTIRENIAYGRPEASMEAVIGAAQAAQAHEFIAELPEGYDTVVGERGVGLSGGQKQRIAIARALLVDPRILILDDSTSSVDAETEYHIQQALQRLMANRTSFVIAQRISTVRDADLILLLHEGALIAQGRHEELMETSEYYAEILESQFHVHTALVEAVEEEMAS
ncbi:MAG: ABC transporter ATP-binding protein/permease [Chloroflexi bacterium]|nr:ABC transporter ATP-binding protein/permease [Chloroflexota bacterium]